MLDGRRIWLVSGSIHYARVPRQLWAERIHAAKLAGLNTIETPVFWNRHEARPGHFDFSGDNDLRAFIELIGKAGLYCILRPGPFVGADWDMGGLPPWLMASKDIVLRRAGGPFLEASSRFITALVDRVRDLQVTSPGSGGAIVLVQNEMAWTCGDEEAAQAYLGEISRYLREAGITVPLINANNLWQSTEGEIDGWTGSGDLQGTMRQFAAVRPDQPRLVVEFNVGSGSTWGVENPEPPHPADLQHRLAQILGAGGQFNLNPFHGGTNFGFWGGRRLGAPDAFVTASNDHQAPLTETGGFGPTFHAVRRLCTFASRFARVFAGLDPSYQPVAAVPAPDAPSGASVVHVSGAQGGVAFVFRGRTADGLAGESVNLLLSNGSTLPVPAGKDQSVTWCLLGASLAGRARLDYSNLNAFALVGRVFVCYGPAGAEGRLSISGTPLETTVPTGREPTILEHEGITVVVCSEEQIDRTFVTDDSVYLGVETLEPNGTPVVAQGWRHCTKIAGDGTVSNGGSHHASARKGGRPAISDWVGIGTDDYRDGTSERFATIDGPADLATLGSPYGLGWYRIRFKWPSGGRVKLMAPGSRDRLHLFLDGKPSGILGEGPGAAPILDLSLRKGQRTIVVLAENLGRVSGGSDLGDSTGLTSHLWAVKPLRVGRPAVKRGDPVDVLAWKTPLWELHPGDLTSPDRLTWTFRHGRKSPVLVAMDALPVRALLLVNNTPVRFIERGSRTELMLQSDQLGRGANTVQVAMLQEPGPDGTTPQMSDVHRAIASSTKFFECVASLSAKADWGFARWEAPTNARFDKAARRGAKAPGTSGPAWWRGHFEGPAEGEAPLFLDAAGLTKGQLYVNGTHVARYFTATATGKRVPPQSHYFIPSPWIKAGQPNTVLIFDEHGGDPSKCRLVTGEDA